MDDGAVEDYDETQPTDRKWKTAAATKLTQIQLFFRTRKKGDVIAMKRLRHEWSTP